MTLRRDPRESGWWRRAAAALAALPPSMRAVLFGAALLHALGVSWGLPSSDGWDCDGIAPRDILPGLAATFTPGDFFTYPPLHLAILALLTLPWTVAAVVHAGTTDIPSVIHEILSPSYMTAFALTARIVSLVMSLGIALALGKIAEEIVRATHQASPPGQRESEHGRDDDHRDENDDHRLPPAERAATFAAATVSVGVAFTYYAHTSNLDVPYLFWASLAALVLVRAIARGEPRRLRAAGLFAACAVATKDQAYALFVASTPALLAAWLLLTRDRARRAVLVREALIALAVVVGATLLLDAVFFNPSGFRARLAFLRGPASQDFSNYSNDLGGKLAIIAELGLELPRHYPWVFAVFVLGGLALAVLDARRPSSARDERSARSILAALAPLAIAVSFTVGFNMAARRTDDRFLLPQMLMFAVYAGIGFERVWSFAAGGRLFRSVARGACVLAFVAALWEALRVDLTLLDEPRYRTEAFLAANVRAGDTVEVHGLNVYLPRFPAAAHVVRVGPTPANRRGPLPGVEEVEAPFMRIDERRPRFVVVSTCYAWRYLPVDTSSHGGHIYPPNQVREAADIDATDFFGGLFAGTLGYHVVHDAKIGDGWFHPIEIHASTNCRTTTFERASP
jgi:4-amino-4-deoxy-L-arabinose transferase-like glycosyltransferase